MLVCILILTEALVGGVFYQNTGDWDKNTNDDEKRADILALFIIFEKQNYSSILRQ